MIGARRLCHRRVCGHRLDVANDKVIEALGVAIQVNAGAALVYSARTLDPFKAKVS